MIAFVACKYAFTTLPGALHVKSACIAPPRNRIKCCRPYNNCSQDIALITVNVGPADARARSNLHRNLQKRRKPANESRNTNSNNTIRVKAPELPTWKEQNRTGEGWQLKRILASLCIRWVIMDYMQQCIVYCDIGMQSRGFFCF